MQAINDSEAKKKTFLENLLSQLPGHLSSGTGNGLVQSSVRAAGSDRTVGNNRAVEDHTNKKSGNYKEGEENNFDEDN